MKIIFTSIVLFHDIFIYNDKGRQGQVSVSYPIVKLEVAKQGVVAALLEDKTSNYIEVYDKEGKQLVSHKSIIDENGYYNATFSINQNQEIYQYFENLIDNIIKCKIFNASDIELGICDTNEQLIELSKNSSVYNRLVQDSTIIWYSDNIYDEKANKLKMEKKITK